MIPCTQFISRDPVLGLEGCYLAWGTFLIGNLIIEPRNLVFVDHFFLTGVNEGLFFLLNFPHLKIKIKVSGDSKQKRSSLVMDFPKLKNQLTFSSNSESRRHVDRVGSSN